MPKKIDGKTVHAAYAEAKRVYERPDERAAAINRLVDEHGMNSSSASGYVYCFLRMMAGKKYARTLNGYATNYYLGGILADYGVEKLQGAVHSVNLHITYYESLRNGNLNNIREVVSFYEKNCMCK